MESLDKIYNRYRIIRKKAPNERDASEKLFIEFIQYIIDFYKIYDVHEKTYHAYILELLFLSKRKLSTEVISQKAHISVKTLYRFKKQYLFFISESLQNGIFGEKFGQILSDFPFK
jgi:hypothetical protein